MLGKTYQAHINNWGNYVIHADVEDNGTVKEGLFAGGRGLGALRTLAMERNGSPLADQPFKGFKHQMAISDGDVVSYTANAGGNKAYFVTDAVTGTHRATAYVGRKALGETSRYRFLGSPVLTDGTGEQLFAARVQSSAEVNARNNSCIMGADNGLLIQEGSLSPIDGMPYGEIVPRLVANSSGDIGFTAKVVGASRKDNQAIFVGTPKNMQMRLRKGDESPVGGQYAAFLGECLNNEAAISVRARLRNGSGVKGSNNDILVTDAGGDMVVVAREGDASPAGPPYRRFDKCFLDNKGDLYFMAYLNRPANARTDQAVFRWRKAEGTTELVWREGDPAPGVEGAVFGPMLSLGIGEENSGMAVICRMVRNRDQGITPENDMGLWLDSYATGGKTLRLILRKGDEMDIGAETPLSVLGISMSNQFNDAKGSGGCGRVLGDQYDLIFKVHCKDGQEGVVTLTPAI